MIAGCRMQQDKREMLRQVNMEVMLGAAVSEYLDLTRELKAVSRRLDGLVEKAERIRQELFEATGGNGR